MKQESIDDSTHSECSTGANHSDKVAAGAAPDLVPSSSAAEGIAVLSEEKHTEEIKDCSTSNGTKEEDV